MTLTNFETSMFFLTRELITLSYPNGTCLNEDVHMKKNTQVTPGPYKIYKSTDSETAK